jgi:hypothetical protein
MSYCVRGAAHSDGELTATVYAESVRADWKGDIIISRRRDLPERRTPRRQIALTQGNRSYGRVGDGWVALDTRTGKDIAVGGGGVPIAVNDYGAVFRHASTLSWVPATDAPD